VRHVVALGIQTQKRGLIAQLLHALYLGCPQRALDVFQHHHRRLRLFNPVLHILKGLPGLDLALDLFLCVVEVRIVDSGRAGNQHVHVARLVGYIVYFEPISSVV